MLGIFCHRRRRKTFTKFAIVIGLVLLMLWMYNRSKPEVEEKIVVIEKRSPPESNKHPPSR
jgi:hypothetical protein